jgi:hypothetical protein
MVVERTDVIASVLRPSPIRTAVPGAPYQPGDVVRVTGSCDEVGEEVGIGMLVGRVGVVEYLEYECGSGQHYPDDPMVGVRFDGGEVRELWRDELELVGRGGA